jgi:hypothetical protein
LTHKGGFGLIDHVIERIENKYWKIEVNNFQAWMFGFYKFIGEMTGQFQLGSLLQGQK